MSIFKDRLTFLTAASVKIDTLTRDVYEFLRKSFGDKQFFFSKKNAFGQAIHVTKEIQTLGFMYLEDAVAESNVLTASKELSIRHWAEISGHSVVRAISSRGLVDLRFKNFSASTIGTQIMLRRYAKFKCDTNSLTYLLDIQKDHMILSTDLKSVVLRLIEGDVVEQTIVANGQKLFTIELDDINPIEHYEVKVYVDGVPWEKVEGLRDMTYDQPAYWSKTGLTNQVDIIFGNGTHGRIPREGAVIRVEYIISRGELGNFESNEFPVFQIINGAFDMAGSEISLNEFCDISKFGGFELGSNGEDFETTRSIIGQNTRTGVLAIDRNFEAYLSRLSFLSRIHVWADPTNSSVKRMTLLPNVRGRIRTYQEYISLPDSAFMLSTTEKDSIRQMIEASKKTYISNELIFIDPEIKKYACIVYLQVNGIVMDRHSIKEQITSLILNHFLDKTFNRNITTNTISKSELTSLIHGGVSNVVRSSLLFISRENEEIKKRGWYNKVVINDENGVQIPRTVRIIVPTGTDPKIGFNEYGDIELDLGKMIPVLSSGFPVLDADSTEHVITDPISIILSDNSGQYTL